MTRGTNCGTAAIQRTAGRWLVLADPKVSELGGLGSTHMAAADVVSTDNAMQWVNVLAALYVKATAK